MNILSNVSDKSLTASSSFLLLLVVFLIFIIPFFPLEWHRILYSTFFTIIFLLSILTLSKYRSKIFYLALVTIFTEWLSELFDLAVLLHISFITNIAFFYLLVALFIMQIAKAREVTLNVILESINGYLMLGMSFSILIALICLIDPNSFSFKHLSESMTPSISYVSNYIYFGFVTLSTLGYGDVVPLTPAARSLAIFTSVTGQMYVAIIIALIVSKYLSQKNSS